MLSIIAMAQSSGDSSVSAPFGHSYQRAKHFILLSGVLLRFSALLTGQVTHFLPRMQTCPFLVTEVLAGLQWGLVTRLSGSLTIPHLTMFCKSLAKPLNF